MMNGLFGGAARSAASVVPALKVQAPNAPAPSRRRGLFGFDPKVSGQDRWMALAATLADLGQGGTENLQRMSEEGRERAELAARSAAMDGLGQALSGGQGAGKGPTATAAGGGGLPTLRNAAPALLAAQRAGIDIGGYVNLLDKAGPDIGYEQGFRFDRRDPTSAPTYAPDLGEGQAPVMQNGQVQGVQNLSGYVDAIGARQRATSDAQNASAASYAGVNAENTAAGTGRGASPYQVETVQGPDGRPITMSRAQLLGAGPIYGQSEADQARDVTQATAEGEAANVTAQRARQAPERIQRYEEALSLIPKAITGFGADLRLGTARAMAAAGNEDAIEAVRATEVYQNLIGRDIGAIVRDMVGAANISNTDRELATRIAGGDTNITPAALTRIVQYELDRQRGYLTQSAPQAQGQAAPQVIYDPQGNPYVVRNGQWVPQ